MRLSLIAIICLGTAIAAQPQLTVPVADGPLTIDGRADEAIWKSAAVLPLQSPQFGVPFPRGGEIRAVVRGGYLCFSAHVPENGRVVARSTGVNPAWWREDLIVWTISFRGFAVSLRVSVNPLGAYSAEYTGAKGDAPHPVVASAALSEAGWSAEAAVPVETIADIGFLSAERIRVPRPEAPELHWYWPGMNDRLSYRLAGRGLPPGTPAVENERWWVAPRERGPALPVEGIAAELASVPARLWPEVQHKDRMWEDSLRARVARAAAAERRDWEQVSNAADWEQFRRSRLDALRASLGPFPSRTPLRAEVTRRLDYGEGFAVENVIFESRPGLVVTANLYVPSRIAGRVPAIVVVHSHHAPKVQYELQDLGMTWARTGAAVLIMDQLGAGERLQSQPWPRESYYSRYALGMQLYLAGESLMKWMVWDLMRGIDLLLERPYVDPKRIVMIGAVAGGGDPAAVTSALDNRIAAVLPFNFGEAGPEEHYTAGPRPYDSGTANPGWGSWESTRNLRLSVAGQFFPWFICASVAPRPFVFSFEVGWPDSVEKEPVWARYRKVWGLYGKPENLAQVDGFGPFTGPGEVTNVGVDLRKKIYPILKRWMDVPVPGGEYHNPRPDPDLMCLTAETAAERKPKAAAELAAGMARERLAAARSKRAALGTSARLGALRADLKAKLGDIEPQPGAAARVLWRKTFSGFAAEAVELDSEPGFVVPLVLLKPATSEPVPVVLAIGQGGKRAFLDSRKAEIAGLLKAGVAVCLADVRGTGETAPAGGRGSTSVAATELMLGNTAMGGRLKDARTVVRYLVSRRDLDSRRVAVWGESFAGLNREPILDQSVNQRSGPQAIEQSDPLGSILALLTALYEDGVRAGAGRGGLVSYGSVLGDRFCYLPQDVIVPGILEAADIADIVAALAPRAVLLDRLADGRNLPAAAGVKSGDVTHMQLDTWIAAQLKR